MTGTRKRNARTIYVRRSAGAGCCGDIEFPSSSSPLLHSHRQQFAYIRYLDDDAKLSPVTDEREREGEREGEGERERERKGGTDHISQFSAAFFPPRDIARAHLRSRHAAPVANASLTLRPLRIPTAIPNLPFLSFLGLTLMMVLHSSRP